MPVWIAVAAGGAFGALLRHGANSVVARYSSHPVPLATTLVNVAGCLAIGLLAGAVASNRVPMGPSARAFVFVGLLGGFTTFSSLGLDTFTLVRQGQPGLAVAAVAVQVMVGLSAVFAGYALTSGD